MMTLTVVGLGLRWRWTNFTSTTSSLIHLLPSLPQNECGALQSKLQHCWETCPVKCTAAMQQQFDDRYSINADT